MIHTNEDYKYGAFSLGLSRQFFKFKVRACNDAHITLSSDGSFDADYSYEIVLSGWLNQRSVIRRCHQCDESVSVDTQQLLSCNDYRQFWISWDNGMVSVGIGWNIGVQIFMEWLIEDQFIIPINFVSLSTGWDSDGDWMVPTAIG